MSRREEARAALDKIMLDAVPRYDADTAIVVDAFLDRFFPAPTLTREAMDLGVRELRQCAREARAYRPTVADMHDACAAFLEQAEVTDV